MSKARSVLGKGLSALIPGVEEDSSYRSNVSFSADENRPNDDASRQGPAMAMIEIAKVAPNAQQPRKDFPQDALDELTQSIRENGVIQAITVRRVPNGRYELVSGERRVRASIEAGLTEIPAYILEVESDRKMLELAIIENVQRLQFNPIEEAEAYERLIEDCDLTQEEVADKISKDRSTITNTLRLLKLPQPIKDSLRKGELGLGHAKVILSLPDPAKQTNLWKEAVTNNYSVRKLEDLVRAITKPNSGLQSHRKKTEEEQLVHSPAVTAMENAFKHVFGTQVRIRMKQDKTGEIALQFYGYEDLERLQELLSSIQPH